jgi:hypothetical protein
VLQRLTEVVAARGAIANFVQGDDTGCKQLHRKNFFLNEHSQARLDVKIH